MYNTYYAVMCLYLLCSMTSDQVCIVLLGGGNVILTHTLNHKNTSHLSSHTCAYTKTIQFKVQEQLRALPLHLGFLHFTAILLNPATPLYLIILPLVLLHPIILLSQTYCSLATPSLWDLISM